MRLPCELPFPIEDLDQAEVGLDYAFYDDVIIQGVGKLSASGQTDFAFLGFYHTHYLRGEERTMLYHLTEAKARMLE